MMGLKNINIHQWVQAGTNKKIVDWLSARISKLLELEFKQHNAIKPKCLKWTVKNILPKYKQWKKYNQKYNR